MGNPHKLDDAGLRAAEKAYVAYDETIDTLVQRAVSYKPFGDKLLAWAGRLTNGNCAWQSYHVGKKLLQWEGHIRIKQAEKAAAK